MARRENLYAILGVARSASADEIKRAYRRVTLESHPDRFPDDQRAAERFRLASEAYEVLGDPARRARYDREVDARGPIGLDLTRGDVPRPGDLLDSVFGDLFGSRRKRNRRGRDIRYTLTVELEEAVLGSLHEITFEAAGPCTRCEGTGTEPGGREAETCPVCDGAGDVKEGGLLARRTTCGRCGGTGMVQPDPCSACGGKGSRKERRSFQVSLPPGTEAGAERVLEGQGEPGRFGAAAGNLRVTVNVNDHAWLSRQGRDISCRLPLSLCEAALGAQVRVPTVDGPVRMTIPRGVQSGARLRLRGKGVPQPDAGSRGDQLVTLEVETPVADADAVRQALEGLEAVTRGRPESMPRRERLRAATREHDAGEDRTDDVS